VEVREKIISGLIVFSTSSLRGAGFLQKLTGAQTVEKSASYVELKSVLQCPQYFASGLYPELVEASSFVN
jgi:hypothetical protein